MESAGKISNEKERKRRRDNNTSQRRKNNIKNAASALVISLLSEQQIEHTPAAAAALIHIVYLAGMIANIRLCKRVRSSLQHKWHHKTSTADKYSIKNVCVNKKEEKNEWALQIAFVLHNRLFPLGKTMFVSYSNHTIAHGFLLFFFAHSFELFRVRRFTTTAF